MGVGKIHTLSDTTNTAPVTSHQQQQQQLGAGQTTEGDVRTPCPLVYRLHETSLALINLPFLVARSSAILNQEYRVNDLALQSVCLQPKITKPFSYIASLIEIKSIILIQPQQKDYYFYVMKYFV